MRASLQSLATDGAAAVVGRVGSGVMQELVPDEQKAFCAPVRLPRLPLMYFKDPIPVPAGWSGLPSGHVLLSGLRAGSGRVARLAGSRADGLAFGRR